jgi:ferrous iron transport protein A
LNSCGSISGNRLPLAFLPEGAKATVLDILGEKSMAGHLAEMGFTPFARVTVLKSSPPGSVLVRVKNARIALGRGMAMQIMVNDVEDL